MTTRQFPALTLLAAVCGFPAWAQAPAPPDPAPLGRRAPDVAYDDVNGQPHRLAPRPDAIQVLHVFGLDEAVDGYAVWQATHHVTLGALRHLQRLHLEGAVDDPAAPETPVDQELAEPARAPQVVFFGLAVEALREPVYGAEPPSGPDTPEPWLEARPPLDHAARRDRLVELTRGAGLTFPLLDVGRDTTLLVDLAIEQNVVLVVDPRGKVRFAAAEDQLRSPDGEVDYLALAIHAIARGDPVPYPRGSATTLEESLGSEPEVSPARR